MMGYVATSTNTSYTITNFELCYEVYHVSFPTQSLPIARASGTQYFSFNIGSFRGIKSVFLLMAPTAPSAVFQNGQYDSYDCTQNSGDYQFLINNVNYPQKALSLAQNRTGLLTELRKACTSFNVFYSSIFDKQNNMDMGCLNTGNRQFTKLSTKKLHWVSC